MTTARNPTQDNPRAFQAEGNYRPFYGKYRGKVVNNIDPLFLGRVMAEVPAVPAAIMNFAMPCTPYAGFEVGFYAIPPMGANVWIEFEGGDPNFPIWSGCFWAEGELPLVAPTAATKIFKTEFITMILNDLPEVGGFTLECLPPAVDVPLTMTFNAGGITLTCPEAVISMTPASITLTVPEAVCSLTPESIEITVPPSSINLTAASISATAPVIDATAEAGIELEAGLDLMLTAGALATLSAGADLALSAGGAAELSAAGDVAISAIGGVEISSIDVEITADVNVLGELTMDGMQVVVLP